MKIEKERERGNPLISACDQVRIFKVISKIMIIKCQKYNCNSKNIRFIKDLIVIPKYKVYKRFDS